LFGLPLAAAVGPGGAVTAVEADTVAADHGARNATAYPHVRFEAGRVEQVLGSVEAADLVVLDPPRGGAGREVMAAITRMAPRAVEYVSCDPATLARDIGYAVASGYRLAGLHAYDAFPMTHHVECIALLVPAHPDAAVRG
ncbi:MAG: class I SAM-dependent RNA methyltransferase, partial [Dermatophilaceae bacterium]